MSQKLFKLIVLSKQIVFIIHFIQLNVIIFRTEFRRYLLITLLTNLLMTMLVLNNDANCAYFARNSVHWFEILPV